MAEFGWGYIRGFSRCFNICYSPPIKSANQQGCIKTSRGNPKEKSRHLIGQYSSSGHFMAIAAEVLLSVVAIAIAAIARATGVRAKL